MVRLNLLLLAVLIACSVSVVTSRHQARNHGFQPAIGDRHGIEKMAQGELAILAHVQDREFLFVSQRGLESRRIDRLEVHGGRV